MAALTCPINGTMRLDLEFLTGSDLAGVVWSSEDRWSHPLLRYRTNRDYRSVKLSFAYAAGDGVMPLDALFGPVLTIEGRDSLGSERVWYVRLWNFAQGAPRAAQIVLDFDDLTAGFEANGEKVFAGDIDRMFISLVPAQFGQLSGALPNPVRTWVELTEMNSVGPRSTIDMGDAFLPEHQLRVASGYDDSYHQAPERLFEQWEALGYRSVVNHYVGMSHYMALSHVGGERFEVSGGLCGPAVEWHRAFLRLAVASRISVILSLSMELFDAHAPDQWAQRDVFGNRALTGWVPPSTLLSPCNIEAMAWLSQIARSFVDIADAEAAALRFQIGEPWWWVGSNGAPCFYDPMTVQKWTAATGVAPPVMEDVLGLRSPSEQTWLGWLGKELARATLELLAATRENRSRRVEGLLLFYAPQVLDSKTPDLARANMPTEWSSPSFDVLQLEDYDFVTRNDGWGMSRARTAVAHALGYPLENQHYISGFVLEAANASEHWELIAAAAESSLQRSVAETFVWAWPQVSRDGFTVFQVGTNAIQLKGNHVDDFHDVLFPLHVGIGARGGPKFHTQVFSTVSGSEQRNMNWANARLYYDAGLGLRSESDIRTIVSFFRARRGQAHGFRFRDPADFSSSSDGQAISAQDQEIAVGDGRTLRFQLVKNYGTVTAFEQRKISRPVRESVRVAIDGDEMAEGWQVGVGGAIEFENPPPSGSRIYAGFLFDVPVRFGTDQLDVSMAGFMAGEITSIPLMEIAE